jgi:hypothetical protein
MRPQTLLIIIAIHVAVAADAQVTAADLVGKWVGDAPAGFHIVFKADHSFDYISGDAHGMGKWELHEGKKLELIFHYDYDPEPISSLSKRSWILIDSLSKDHMRVRKYSWEYNKNISPAPDVQPLPAEVWTKQQ